MNGGPGFIKTSPSHLCDELVYSATALIDNLVFTRSSFTKDLATIIIEILRISETDDL